MRKLKLLLVACALLGASQTWAQTDVTATYITNPSFESDGAITASNGALAITGWTQSDPTSSFNNTGCYDASTNIPTQGTVTVTPSDGTYFLFFRKGWAQNTYTFTSEAAKLPSGKYKLSVDYKMVEGYDNTQNNSTTVTISAKNGDTTLGTATGNTKTNVSGGGAYTYLNTADWSTVTAEFSLDEETNATFVIALKAGGQRRSDFVVDNVKLLYEAVVRPTAIGLNETSLALSVGGTATLAPSYTPTNANTDTDITWESSDVNVAAVANGVVTAVGPGSATITATTANNVSATCSVTVTDVTAATAPSFCSEIAAGDFYLVNAATGKYLGTLKEGWGTQAALTEHGIPFTVTISDGKYTLDSHTYNNNNDHFLNNGWVDGASTSYTITSLGNGKYSIAAGETSFLTATATTVNAIVNNSATTANSVLAQWYFVSKDNRESMLAGAINDSPVDATFYIVDPDFSRNHIIQLLQNGQTTKNPGGETYPWEYTATNYHFKGGDNGNMCAETYQNGGGKIYQTLSNVRNGKYVLKCQGFHNGSNPTYLYANDEQVELKVLNANNEGTAASMAGASAAFTAGQYNNELTVYVTDGELTIGIENASSNWACFDNFELYYYGPTIAGEAEELPETAMEANKWYYFDVDVDGDYDFTTTTLNDIVYTTDGTILIENESSVTANFSSESECTLTAGRYYVKSASEQTFAVAAHSFNYVIGTAALSTADGGYTQSPTFTVTFPEASTNDPDGVAALAASSTATVNGNSVALTAAEGGFSLDLGTLTANTDYTIAIPAGVYGYNSDNMNEAISVTIHTPVLFDGEYCFYDAYTKSFMGRGAAWGTELVVDKYGIPFNLTTDANGVSAIEFVDWTGVYVFKTNDNGMFTDNASTGWTILAADAGYKIKTASGDLYAKVENGGYGYYVHAVEGENNATVWTLKTKAERDAIIAAYPTENISNVITASGISTTAAEFASYLSTNYQATDVTSNIGTATFTNGAGDWTWSGVRGQDNQPAYGTGFAEVWNATGSYTQTITNLPAGIYKVTVQGYERRRDNNTSTALKSAGYNLVSTYLSANGEQVRFTDWNEVAGKPTNTGGAVSAFGNGEATNEVYVYLDGNTDLTLTVKKPNYIWDCWTIFNNFTLTRYDVKVTIDEDESYEPVAVDNAYVTFNRTLVAGWNGMVLPFNMSVQDAETTFNATAIKDFTGITSSSDGITLNFADATEITAGKPFMMKVTAPAENNSYTISSVSLSDEAVLQPIEKTDDTNTYTYTMTGSYAASTDLSNVVFALIQGDQYFYHNTGKPSSAKAFRAWFVNESTDEAGSRISFNFGDDVITGINEVQTNGQDAEAVYNLQGQRVVNAKKGLFIQNGKKVVIK